MDTRPHDWMVELQSGHVIDGTLVSLDGMVSLDDLNLVAVYLPDPLLYYHRRSLSQLVVPYTFDLVLECNIGSQSISRTGSGWKLG